jgi:hypothetical protein
MAAVQLTQHSISLGDGRQLWAGSVNDGLATSSGRCEFAATAQLLCQSRNSDIHPTEILSVMLLRGMARSEPFHDVEICNDEVRHRAYPAGHRYFGPVLLYDQCEGQDFLSACL